MLLLDASHQRQKLPGDTKDKVGRKSLGRQLNYAAFGVMFELSYLLLGLEMRHFGIFFDILVTCSCGSA